MSLEIYDHEQLIAEGTAELFALARGSETNDSRGSVEALDRALEIAYENLHVRIGASLNGLSPADIPTHINQYIEQYGNKYLPLSEAIVINAAKSAGIDNIGIDCWYGPQGAGKGTLGYSLSRVTGSYVPESGDIAEFIRDISESTDVITSGTGGFIVPAPPNGREVDRFRVHKAIQPSLMPIVNSGNLVSDTFTALMTNIEIAKSLLSGKSRIQVDTFPRSIGELRYFQEFQSRLRANGVPTTVSNYHLELLDSDGCNSLMQNREMAIATASDFANSLVASHQLIEEQGFVGDVYQRIRLKHGIEPTDVWLQGEGSTIYRTEAISIVNEFSDALQTRLRLMVSAQEGSMGIINKDMFNRFVNSVGISLSRIAIRLADQRRTDESDVRIITKRLSNYYGNTLIAALSLGLPIIPAAGDPAEAMKELIKALADQKGYNFDNNEEFSRLLEFAGNIHFDTVNNPKR